MDQKERRMELRDGPRVERVLLASPRGWCAGVDRAIAMVDQELEAGVQVHLNHPVIHSTTVADDLERRGARIVADVAAIPPGATMVISAHGAPPSLRRTAVRQGVRVVDATCPLVSKVHAEVRRCAAAGYSILLVAHHGHVEAVGTQGEAPEATTVVSSVEEVERFVPADPARVAWVCQTTLSVTDAAEIVAAIRRRFPSAVGPRTDDICYATTNRQDAVVQLARRSQLVLVVGSSASSNSRRLVERAREQGCPAHLIESVTDIDDGWLVDVRVLGLTSGASTPESLVDEALDWFRRVHGAEIEDVVVAVEDVTFSVPAAREPSAAPTSAAVS